MTKVTQFIGEKEVKSIEGTLVTFTDDSQKTFTEKYLSYMLTEQSKDLSSQRDMLLEAIVPVIMNAVKASSIEDDNIIVEVLNILEDYDVRYGDIDAVLSHVAMSFDSVLKTIANSFNQAFLEALGKAFNTHEEGKPASFFKEDIRMSDIIRIRG